MSQFLAAFGMSNSTWLRRRSHSVIGPPAATSLGAMAIVRATAKRNVGGKPQSCDATCRRNHLVPTTLGSPSRRNRLPFGGARPLRRLPFTFSKALPQGIHQVDDVARRFSLFRRLDRLTPGFAADKRLQGGFVLVPELRRIEMARLRLQNVRSQCDHILRHLPTAQSAEI